MRWWSGKVSVLTVSKPVIKNGTKLRDRKWFSKILHSVDAEAKAKELSNLVVQWNTSGHVHTRIGELLGYRKDKIEAFVDSVACAKKT